MGPSAFLIITLTLTSSLYGEGSARAELSLRPLDAGVAEQIGAYGSRDQNSVGGVIAAISVWDDKMSREVHPLTTALKLSSQHKVCRHYGMTLFYLACYATHIHTHPGTSAEPFSVRCGCVCVASAELRARSARETSCWRLAHLGYVHGCL